MKEYLKAVNKTNEILLEGKNINPSPFLYAYRVYAADNQQKSCRKAGDFSPAFTFQQGDKMPKAQNTLIEGNKIRLSDHVSGCWQTTLKLAKKRGYVMQWCDFSLFFCIQNKTHHGVDVTKI